MPRLRTYSFAFAALGALAITAGFAPVPAVAQTVDPFQVPSAGDNGEVFDDALPGRRGLRGRLDPESRSASGSEEESRSRTSADQATAGSVRFGERPDPFRDPFREPDDPLRDPLRDPLTAPDLETAQTAGRNENPGGENIEEDPYAALGIQVGSFVLFPEISAESLYDDNLFQSSTDPKGDWALVLTSSLRVQSLWSRHSLIGTLSGLRSFHDKFSGENDETYSAGVEGRLDIRRTTNLVAEANYAQFLEDRSSTDFPAGAAGRAETRTLDLSLEGNHTFNRVTLTLRGDLAKEDFDDGVDENGAVINNDDRDLTERRVTARASYEFRPDVAAFLEASVNERDFAESVDDDGTRNGSSGHELQGGLSFELTGKLTGEFSAGYATQTPDEDRLSDIDGLIFNASLEWQATGLTTFFLDASSEIEETTQSDSAGSIVRAVGISIEHRPRRNITLGASLGYGREEFAGNGVVDEEYEFGITGEYIFNRSAALTAEYSYLESTSSTPDNDYSVNQLRLGVRLRR